MNCDPCVVAFYLVTNMVDVDIYYEKQNLPPGLNLIE